MKPDVTAASFRFSLALKDKIWQVALSAGTGRLIAESRNESEQRINYYLINLLTDGEVKEVKVDETDWWTSTLHFFDPYLLLEQYEDTNDPSAKNLLIFNVAENLQEARIPGFQFESKANNEVTGVDPKDTQTKKSYVLNKEHPDGGHVMQSPVYYHSGSESCQLVECFLERTSSGLGCEYFEQDDFIIICYYVRLGTKFDRWLRVIRDEQELYHQKIDSQMDGFASGGFFLLNRLLVFIENQNKINGIEL